MNTFYSKKLGLYGAIIPNTSAVILFDPKSKRFLVGELIDGDIGSYTNIVTESQPNHFGALPFFLDGIAIGGEGEKISIKRLDGSNYQLTLPSANPSTTGILKCDALGNLSWTSVTEAVLDLYHHALATGLVNGINHSFVSVGDIVCVFVNGLQQLETAHYTKTSATTFTLNDAPLSGDVVSTTFTYSVVV